jgi:hypothetical protein
MALLVVNGQIVPISNRRNKSMRITPIVSVNQVKIQVRRTQPDFDGMLRDNMKKMAVR